MFQVIKNILTLAKDDPMKYKMLWPDYCLLNQDITSIETLWQSEVG